MFPCPLCNNKPYKQQTGLTKHLAEKHKLHDLQCSDFEGTTPMQRLQSQTILETYWNTHFDPEQLDVIRSPLQDCTLMACPGSGKTRVCVGLVHYLIKQERLRPNNILSIMFGRDATDNFKKRIEETGLTGIVQNYVRTIHSLAGAIMHKLGQPGSTNINTIVAAAEAHLCRITKETFAKSCPEYSDVKVIIVDEAQDISGVQHDFVMALRNVLTDCVVYMVGDSNQGIYQFQGGSDQYLRKHAPNNRKYLIRNYRSTEEIIGFSNEHRPWKDTPAMIPGIEQHGKKPVWYTHQRRSDALNKIMEEIRECVTDDIAIIGPFKVNNKQGNENPHNVALNPVLDRLHLEGIPYEVCYNVSSDDDRGGGAKNKSRQKKGKVQDEAVKLYTIHGSKGLEFKKVILIDFQFKTFKKTPSASEYREYEYLWFVGMTRAKCELSIHSVVVEDKVEKGNFPWPAMKECARETYLAVHYAPWTVPDVLPFMDNMPPKLTWSVTELLTEMTNKGGKWDERRIMSFERQLNFVKGDWKLTYGTTDNNGELTSCDDYPPLYGDAAHYMVEVAYNIRHKMNMLPSFVQSLLHELENITVVPPFLSHIVPKFYQRFGVQCLEGGMLQVSALTNNYAYLSKEERRLADYIISRRQQDDVLFIHVPSSNYWFNKETLTDICHVFDNIKDATSELLQSAIFKIALYRFQKRQNLSHLMSRCQELFIKIQPFLKRIVRWVNTSDDFISLDWRFEILSRHPCMNLFARADAIDPSGTIVEFKFMTSDDFSYEHKLQVLLTYNNVYPAWREKLGFRLIDIRKGVSQDYSFVANKKKLIMAMVDTMETKLNNICLLYDLETTDLDIYLAEAIDRYFYDPILDMTVSSGLVRPLNLPLPPEIEYLTNITTADVLAPGADSHQFFCSEMQEFLQVCNKPILVAHNGSQYDHKYLCLRGLVTETNSVKFLDSRFILRLMPGIDDDDKADRKTTLVETYKRIVGHPWMGEQHRAKVDVEIMKEFMGVAGLLNIEKLQQLAVNAPSLY